MLSPKRDDSILLERKEWVERERAQATSSIKRAHSRGPGKGSRSWEIICIVSLYWLRRCYWTYFATRGVFKRPVLSFEDFLLYQNYSGDTPFESSQIFATFGFGWRQFRYFVYSRFRSVKYFRFFRQFRYSDYFDIPIILDIFNIFDISQSQQIKIFTTFVTLSIFLDILGISDNLDLFYILDMYDFWHFRQSRESKETFWTFWKCSTFRKVSRFAKVSRLQDSRKFRNCKILQSRNSGDYQNFDINKPYKLIISRNYWQVSAGVTLWLLKIARSVYKIITFNLICNTSILNWFEIGVYILISGHSRQNRVTMKNSHVNF